VLLLQDSIVDTNDTTRKIEMTTTTTTATTTTATTVVSNGTRTARITTTKNNNNNILSGSVQRHFIFLDYCKFERSVTTLIVTLVGKKDLLQLLERLQKANNNTSDDDNNNDNTPNEEEEEEEEVVQQQQQMLNIIKISKLKTILTEMKQEQWYVRRNVVHTHFGCTMCVTNE
jgi:parvulin-like peptidyl-prolyl isomerase